MTSQDQVRRMLVEVPYLQAHPGVSVNAVAQTFGISSAQVLKDLDVLWMCGLPGGLPGDLIEMDMDAAQAGGAIRLSNAEYLSRPMRFSRDEAVSLMVALRSVEEMVTGEQAEAVASALAKLARLTRDAASAPIDLQIASGNEQVRAALICAIGRRHQVRLSYDGVARGRTTTPLVDPAEIVLREGTGYLVGWNVDRGGWRNYRLDRIAQAQELDTPSTGHGVPPDSDSWFEQSTGEVTLQLASSAAWVAEYCPIRQRTDLPDGGVRVRLAVSDPSWLRRLLLRLGDEVQEVRPPEATQQALAEANQVVALYGEVFGSTQSW